jgi:hypothetical protein
MVTGATFVRGRSGTSCRRLVDRDFRGLSRVTEPRTPDWLSCCSTWSFADSMGMTSSPLASALWCARSRSARVVASSVCRSLGSSGSRIGSWSACQPCRHWALRRLRWRSAHGGHLSSVVAPHGTSTISLEPVSGSIRRNGTGRMHTPCLIATCSTTCVATGIRERAAREPSGGITEAVGAPVSDDMHTRLTRDSDRQAEEFRDETLRDCPALCSSVQRRPVASRKRSSTTWRVATLRPFQVGHLRAAGSDASQVSAAVHDGHEALHGGFELGHVMIDRCLQDGMRGIEVAMSESVTHAGDLRPRDTGLLVEKACRWPCMASIAARTSSSRWRSWRLTGR